MFHNHVFVYVEDDLFSREALDLVLRRLMGVRELWIFEDSTDFMPRVRALPRRVDVFLLDIHMRPYTGFEMLYMLRNDPVCASARVIALTASVMSEEVHLLRTSGFDGIISKPIDVIAFPRLIERAMTGEPVWNVTG